MLENIKIFFETFKNVFRIPELRKRVLFTLGIIFVYRIGGHVPTPGIDPRVLADFFSQNSNSLFGLYDMFVGGAFKRVTVFALGIMPYISASIILQLMGSVFPYIHKLQKEGAEGRKKITQYTRYGTVLLSIVQAVGISVFLQSIVSPSHRDPCGVAGTSGVRFTIITAISLTTGTILIMWLGEQITNRGIGNGISLIIFIGIVARLPDAVLGEIQQLLAGTAKPVRRDAAACGGDRDDRVHRSDDPGDAEDPDPDAEESGRHQDVRRPEYRFAAPASTWRALFPSFSPRRSSLFRA